VRCISYALDFVPLTIRLRDTPLTLGRISLLLADNAVLLRSFASDLRWWFAVRLPVRHSHGSEISALR
jgi:hypothetical protein